MKNWFTSLMSLAALTSMFACHEPQLVKQPALPATPALVVDKPFITPVPPLPPGNRFRTKQITEDASYAAGFSQRLTQFEYDQSNRLIIGKGYARNTLYSYQADGTLATEKEFYTSPSAELYTKESLSETNYEYKNGRVSRQSHRRYMVGGGLFRLSFPVRLLQKDFQYNSQGQVISEIDSVWATSEYRNDVGYVALSSPRFVSVAYVTYEYNDRGQVSLSTQQWYKDDYNDFGPVGPTTYTYDYYPNTTITRMVW